MNRIKRSQLFRQDEEDGSFSTSSDPSPDDGSHAEKQHGAIQMFEYDFINPSQTEVLAVTSPMEDQNQTTEAQSFQFRLFSKTLNTNNTLVLARSPTPTSALPFSDGRIRFLNPHRPQSYYFTSAMPVSKLEILKAQYSSAALATSDVMMTSTRQKWPGAALPWRVSHLKPPHPGRRAIRNASSPQKPAQGRDDGSLARTKPSKKRRVLLRRRLAERMAVLTESQARQVELGLAEREKRTRRNREKKVKRKERDKKRRMDQAGSGIDLRMETKHEDDVRLRE